MIHVIIMDKSIQGNDVISCNSVGARIYREYTF